MSYMGTWPTSVPPSAAQRPSSERYPAFVTGVEAPVYVVQRRVDDFPVDTRRSGARPEVRLLGSCGAFQYLEGVISVGPLSLVLFEGGRGGHMASDALFEMVV